MIAAISNHPREFVGLLAMTLATAAIFVNALWLQTGPHPAPIFAPRIADAVEPRRVATEPNAPTRAQTVSGIQRELARRGFYDGTADGVWGAKTDSAVRDFLQAAGLRMSSDPNDALLRAIIMSNVKKRVSAVEPARKQDPIAELIAPPIRIVAVQRALSDFGYGQIRPSGVLGADTQAAIEKFERDRRMPVTGQISDQLMRELSTMTGRPLE